MAVGVAAGLVASWMLAQLAAKQLFGIGAHDPATLAVATAVLVAVGCLAGFLPARRAAAGRVRHDQGGGHLDDAHAGHARRGEVAVGINPIPTVHRRRVRLLGIHQQQFEHVRGKNVQRVITRLGNLQHRINRIRGQCPLQTKQNRDSANKPRKTKPSPLYFHPVLSEAAASFHQSAVRPVPPG